MKVNKIDSHLTTSTEFLLGEAFHRKHPPSGSFTTFHITVCGVHCSSGVISWGNGVIHFVACIFPQPPSSTSTSSNFPHCPEWLENPKRTTGETYCIQLWVMHVGGESKTDSRSIRKAREHEHLHSGGSHATHTNCNMSCGCIVFWSAEDPVRAGICTFCDGFLLVWWTWIHNSFFFWTGNKTWHLGSQWCCSYVSFLSQNPFVEILEINMLTSQ